MFGLSLKEKIKNGTDEQIVELLAPFLEERVSSAVGFINNQDGLVVGYRSYLVVGDLMIPTENIMFDWPYQPMPIPEAFKGATH